MNNDLYTLQESWRKIEESLDSNKQYFVFYSNCELKLNEVSRTEIDSDSGHKATPATYWEPGEEELLPYVTEKIVVDISVNGGIQYNDTGHYETADVDITKVNIPEVFKRYVESSGSKYGYLYLKYDIENEYEVNERNGDLLNSLKLIKIKNIKVNNPRDITVNAIIEFELTKSESEQREPDFDDSEPDFDDRIDEADKVTAPRKRMPLSQVYNLTGVVDENAAKNAIKDYIKANGVSEYDAMRNITEEIREFASATMNRCTKSLNLFRKVGAKKPSLDDHLNAIDDQDIEVKPIRK